MASSSWGASFQTRMSPQPLNCLLSSRQTKMTAGRHSSTSSIPTKCWSWDQSTGWWRGSSTLLPAQSFIISTRGEEEHVSLFVFFVWKLFLTSCFKSQATQELAWNALEFTMLYFSSREVDGIFMLMYETSYNRRSNAWFSEPCYLYDHSILHRMVECSSVYTVNMKTSSKEWAGLISELCRMFYYLCKWKIKCLYYFTFFLHSCLQHFNKSLITLVKHWPFSSARMQKIFIIQFKTNSQKKQV